MVTDKQLVAGRDGAQGREALAPSPRSSLSRVVPEDQEQLRCGPAAAANASHSTYLAPVPLKGWPSTKTYKIQKGKRKQSEETVQM